MRRQSIVGFASFLTLSALFLSACGDNKAPSLTGTGGVTDGGTPDGATGGLGGAGGAGGGAPATCSASFVAPVDGAMLNVGSDPLVGACMTDGFHAKITVATSQPDGTTATLSVGNATSGTAKVTGSVVTFSNVSLPQGSQTLKVSFSTTCSVSAKVTVDCNLPTCTINKPALTTVHPALNGVPAAQGGDRASADGAAYQVAFSVDTDIEDGQPVKLTVMRSAVLSQQTVLTTTAMSGHAVFAGVPLSPDANYDVQAACTNKAGAIGYSASPAVYPVDTAPPDLTISSPANDAFMGPTMLTNGAFKVCAKTTSPDATTVNLPAGTKNLCVAIGNAACANPTAVTATATDTCVDVPCPGSAPFDINVTLSDAAGNATKKTITNVACASTLPGVQIISPSNDGSTPAFSDPAKRLLSASSSNTLKDQVAGTLGAQWTVVACANKAGMAALYGGQQGATLTAIGAPVATVAATASDNCPAGYGFVAKFSAATLPESAEDATGKLMTPTELRVDVTDVTTALGSSPVVDLWVDSIAPTVGAPAICNTLIQTATTSTQDVTLISTSDNLTLTVASSVGTMDYTPASYVAGVLRFNAVPFPPGQDTVTGTGTDAAGNVAGIPQPCVVTVGTPPIITMQTPTSTQNLCANGTVSTACIADTDAATAGWQGTLNAAVAIAGAPATSGTVTFTASTIGVLGTANIDGTGHASLPGVALPDGTYTLTVQTSEIAGNGQGTLSRTLVVDTSAPTAPTGLAVAVNNRRQTSYKFSGVAPADGTAPVAGYDIRVSTAPINEANFAAATVVTDSGAASAPGQPENRIVSNLYIEKQYYFAVAAKDAAGNRSPIATYTPTAAETAHFLKTILTGPLDGTATTGFGATIDAVDDFTGDGKADLIITERSARRVFVYSAGADPSVDNGPTLTLAGTAQTFYGLSAASVGDVDGDGKPDLAVSAPRAGNGVVNVYLGGSATWIGATAPRNDQTVDATITADSAAYTSGSTLLGYPIVRLGDINGDGLDDFAVSVFGFNANRGRVVVVLGKKPFTSFSLSDTTRVLTVDGEMGTTGRFGQSVAGLGAKNGTILVAAPGVASVGRIYGYRYDATTNALVPVGNPITGGGTSGNYGNAMFILGANGGLLISNPTLRLGTSSGLVDLYFGSTPSNPFAGALTFYDRAASGTTDSVGRVLAGGGFSGTNYQISLIGSDQATPDILVAPNTQAGAVPPLFIVDGAKLSSLSSPVDLVQSADVSFSPLPADWAGSSVTNNLVRDFDGDGYGDIAIGELNGTSPTGIRGRVLILR